MTFTAMRSWRVGRSSARVVRQLSVAQIEGLRRSAQHYVDNARRFKAGLRKID